MRDDIKRIEGEGLREEDEDAENCERNHDIMHPLTSEYIIFNSNIAKVIFWLRYVSPNITVFCLKHMELINKWCLGTFLYCQNFVI
jgi:hypothetical protein